jgi:hypothetical protein
MHMRNLTCFVFEETGQEATMDKAEEGQPCLNRADYGLR